MVGNIVYISPLQADSMLNQANLFRKLLQEHGYRGIFKNTISVEDLSDDDVLGGIWFQLASINFIGEAIVPYLLSPKPTVLYVTLEGVLTKGNVVHSNISKCEFIAVSEFVRECLETSGLKVKKVVHHAIDWKLCGEIGKKNRFQKKQIEQVAGEKVKFLVVARNDPRKNLQGLAKAIKILNDSGYAHEFVVFMISDENAKPLFEKLDNVVFLKNFGGSAHEFVLGYMEAVDYLIHPAVCEGFGLPILEANACGTPAIHLDAPPMNEFTTPDFNFMFSFIDKQPVKANPYQYWIFHLYAPEMLAEMIAFAIDVYRNNPDEYKEYCIKAREWTKDWDYHVKYVELMEELGIHVDMDTGGEEDLSSEVEQ